MRGGDVEILHPMPEKVTKAVRTNSLIYKENKTKVSVYIGTLFAGCHGDSPCLHA
jgi:hypothetical protein